jgi:CRP/FNR family cyclic AMP-dependent transcriptional regulator
MNVAPAVPMDEVVRLLAAHGTVHHYPRNTVVITEGDTSDSLYVIVSGRLKVFMSDEEGHEVTLDHLGPGQYVGEMAFDDSPRSASVVTVEPSVLSVLSGRQFREFVAGNPDATTHFIRNIIRRARLANEKIRGFALFDVYGRIARLLTDHVIDKDGRQVVDEYHTQQEIAASVGCSREMVSRIFKELVAGGFLSIEGRRIVIEKPLPHRW